MNSIVTKGFRKQLDALPTEVQDQAGRTYALWRSDPYHPSLQFKQVSQQEPIYSTLYVWESAIAHWDCENEITYSGSGLARTPSTINSSSDYRG